SARRLLTMPIRCVEVAHRAHQVSLRISELDQLTDGGNRHLGHRDLPALARNHCGNLVDVVHGDGALKADAPLLFLGPLMHRAMNAGMVFVTCSDQEKARGTPGREAPSEYPLIEFARAVHVICVHIEVGNVPRDHWRPPRRRYANLTSNRLTRSRWAARLCR